MHIESIEPRQCQAPGPGPTDGGGPSHSPAAPPLLRQQGRTGAALHLLRRPRVPRGEGRGITQWAHCLALRLCWVRAGVYRLVDMQSRHAAYCFSGCPGGLPATGLLLCGVSSGGAVLSGVHSLRPAGLQQCVHHPATVPGRPEDRHLQGAPRWALRGTWAGREGAGRARGGGSVV